MAGGTLGPVKLVVADDSQVYILKESIPEQDGAGYFFGAHRREFLRGNYDNQRKLPEAIASLFSRCVF